MAPARLRSAGTKRARAAGVALPPDLVYEVLRRLPGDAACRFRAVCRSWRALLSCQSFVAAHAARQGPLLLAGAQFVNSCLRAWYVDIVDLAGDIVRRTRMADYMDIEEILTCGSLACVVGMDNRARVLDPATGAMTELPHELSEKNKQWVNKFQVLSYAFGRATSTGEYKVLRLLNALWHDRWEQLVEVLTLHGGHGESTRWRVMPSPPFDVDGSSMDGNGIAVIDSVMYFVARMDIGDGNDFVAPGSIASFNLETEEWMTILHGPLKSNQENPDLIFQEHHPLPSPLLNLTELEGFLVTVHSERSQPSSTDLWFLTDAKEETWIKKYSIQVELFPQRHEFYAHPLFVLNERKIVLSVRPKGELLVYDLQEGTCRYFDLRNYVAFGLYKGCLLSLISGVDNE